jgi:isopenicillin-N epimerase
VKLPVRAIAAAVGRVNVRRSEADRVLLCVDGVHGFGVEDEDLQSLACHFLVAGTHKWLFGPRGTGVILGADALVWKRTSPTIPPFGARDLPGGRMSPGGFYPFEHRWALAEAFRMHLAIGKRRVQERIHSLASQFKEGLAAIPGAVLQTPRSQEHSSGICVFDLRGTNPAVVVRGLRERGIVATRSPYGTRSVRVTPSIVNTPEEIDRTLRALHELA